MSPAADGYDVIFEKFNPYHDAKGRFASSSGATSFTYAPGASRTHDDAIAREKKRTGEGFGNATAKEFAGAVTVARDSCPEDSRWRVTAHTTEELKNDFVGARLHVTKGGSTVAVAADGDIVSVCKKQGSGERGKELMEIAVKNGGTKLDSFSGNHDFYTACGFEPVSWTPFNETYAPPGWRKGIDKPEEVVFYKYTGKKNSISLSDFLAKTKPFEGDDGYDQAMKFRNDSMEG